MERRGCGTGAVMLVLGLALSCCLLPYLISSVYSVMSTLLQEQPATQWLWGDWLSSIIPADNPLYRLLVEAPICCGAALALLVAVLGFVWLFNNRGPRFDDAAGDELEAESDWDAPAQPLDGGEAPE